MIGLTVLSESEGWLHQLDPTGALKTFCEQHRFSMDRYDYDQHTFLDLLDYMDFQEFEHYLFVLRGQGERTLRLVAYLQQRMLHVQFHLINERGDVLFGDPYFLDKTIPLEGTTGYTQPIELQDALMSLFTGVYPDTASRQPQPLRHVYVETTDLLDSITPTLFDQMTINSLLYIDQSTRHDLPVIELMSRTPVLLAFSDTLPFSVRDRLATFERSDLDAAMQQWQETGVVLNPEQRIGILDYATLTGMPSSHRLFIHRDGIYADYEKRILLSKAFDLNICQLRQNQLATWEVLLPIPQLALYPILFQLASAFQGTSQFVTPYSVFELPRTEGKLGPLTMIGIQNKEGCFAFELLTNQLFETDEVFLAILEADQKERFDVLPKRLGTDYEAAVRTYKELIYHG
ncbi:hypothetical protein [Exiguobacterium sp. K1]|uniref:hypothetical protein n=1 Tax=Exiguobacterium sp. K1 TaxID=2980105 RepID=UPI00299E5520|nr:hypothetical protein [Exiguobacterium sp. K1]MDX1259458.1 hypothetical protein [Exiguobacterium sp. K1]